MSHTLHRRGTPDSLSRDYVVFAMSAKGINAENSKYALKEFLDIVTQFNWVNMGDMKTGGYYLVGKDAIMEGVQDTSIVHGVFTSKEDMKAAVKALKEADLGVSITISGIINEVRDGIMAEGLAPHTVEVSMGIKGRTDKLPEGAYKVLALADGLVDGYPMVQIEYRGETVYAAILDDRCRLTDAPEEGLELRLRPVPNEGDRKSIEAFCKNLGFSAEFIW